MTLRTFGASWGADPLPPRAVTPRQKADLASKAEAQRLNAMPVQVRAWRDRLDLDALEALAAVAREYQREGLAPVRLHVPTLAKAMKCEDREAEARLERCLRAGALERRRRLAADPVFIPLARGPVTATKAERDLADLRNVVEDARAKIEGKPVPQRAKAETSAFPAGTLLGLRRV